MFIFFQVIFYYGLILYHLIRVIAPQIEHLSLASLAILPHFLYWRSALVERSLP
jgi:hypothetical protein